MNSQRQRSSVGGGDEVAVDTMVNANRGGEGMTEAGDEGRDDETKVVTGAACATSTATTASSHRHNNLVMEELTMDSETLEERGRNALAHALSLRGGGGGDGGEDEDNYVKKQQQRSSGRASAATTASTAEAASSSSLLPDASSTAKLTTVAAAISARPQPNYPPASELIFGTGGKRPRTEVSSSTTTAATAAATVAAVAVVGDGTNEPPPKRKAGRPRKSLAAADTTTTNVARKLSLSSTITTDANAGATIVPTAAKAATVATISATTISTSSTTTAVAPPPPKRKVGRPRKPISHPPSRPNSRGSIHDDTTNKNITTDNNHTDNHASSHTNNDDADNTVGDTNECYEKNHYDANNASTVTTSSTSLPPSSSTSNLLQPQTSSTSSPYYDDEYARFMRSIIGDEEDDDRSILTFKTLQSIRTTTNNNNNNDNTQGATDAGSAVFENTTLDEDDFSYQLTSEGEEEEEDDDEDEDEMGETEEDEGEKAMQSPPRGRSTMQPSSSLSSPTLTLDDDEDLLNVLGEIEDLMEEDLEFAAMASLIGGSGFDDMTGAAGGAGGGANDELGGPSSRVGGGKTRETNAVGTIVGTLQKQMAVTTPGVSTKKKKSTTTVVTTPPQCTSRDRQAAAASANNNSNVNSSLGIIGVGGIDVSPVTKGQLARLRKMMAHHHQLLLQQATLSVRAAYVQKVRKDGLSSNTASTTASEGTRRSLLLPESRLETKSLNFISKPVASECSYVNDFFGGETPDELSECLDGSVGMLQDLEQNWKDAVRKSIQLPPHSTPVVAVTSQSHVSGARKLKLGESESSSSANNTGDINVGVGHKSKSDHGRSSSSSRRLTRSALTKTLLERDLESVHDKVASPTKKHPASSLSSTSTSTAANTPSRISVFDIRGLSRMKAAFSALDNSVKDVVMGREKGKNEDGINVLAPDAHGKACDILLKHARAEIDMECLPGGQDLGACLTHAPEAFDEPDKVHRPLTKQQEAELRRNRHTFTAGEDNLILRGVNIYGEKEWCLVSDRFLPDRVFNSISQRYYKLCFLIYKANGIEIDDKGKLPPIPHFAKGATYDVAKAETLTPARAPTTMNVHRWTLEEDIAILKAAPIMGKFWAEIGARLLPHRDRGHIRKRFQVLQRRIPKGVTKMNMNYLKRPVEHPMKSTKSPKRTKVVVTQPAVPRPPTTKKQVPKNKPPQPPARKQPSAAPPSPAHIFHQGIQAPAAAEESSPISSSPARIFQLADQARKQRPPMSPIDSAQPSKTVQPFSNRGSPQALLQAVETIQSSCIDGPSPETKIVASVLGGFSQSSHNMDENSQMHVEKILGDEWSQASRMGRLILAGNAESNFVGGRLADGDGTVEPGQVGEMLPAYQIPYGDEASRLSVINDEHQTDSEAQRRGQVIHGERKSILSSVMEKTNKNASKRKNTTTAFPSTPTKVPSNLHEGNSCAVSDEYHSSSIHPTTVNLSTPAKEARSVLDATQGETTMNQEFFEYFMSDKSRSEEGSMMPDGGDVPSVDNMEMIFSPAKTNTMMMMSPIKIGKMTTTTSTTMMTSSTPLSQFGTIGSISGPLDGENSLFMHASVFDAASALKDLSTSTPNTPSKLRSRDDFQEEADDVEDAQYHLNDAAGMGDIKGEDTDEAWTIKSSFPKTSFFGKVKARLSSDNAEERKSG